VHELWVMTNAKAAGRMGNICSAGGLGCICSHPVDHPC